MVTGRRSGNGVVSALYDSRNRRFSARASSASCCMRRLSCFSVSWLVPASLIAGFVSFALPLLLEAGVFGFFGVWLDFGILGGAVAEIDRMRLASGPVRHATMVSLGLPS